MTTCAEPQFRLRESRPALPALLAKRDTFLVESTLAGNGAIPLLAGERRASRCESVGLSTLLRIGDWLSLDFLQAEA
jgi:hypothetical protein